MLAGMKDPGRVMITHRAAAKKRVQFKFEKIRRFISSKISNGSKDLVVIEKRNLFFVALYGAGNVFIIISHPCPCIKKSLGRQSGNRIIGKFKPLDLRFANISIHLVDESL